MELKRRYFEYYYSENQYVVSIKEDTAYPCLHSPKTTNDEAQYAISKDTQYAVFNIWNKYSILEDIKRGPYSKKSPICRDLDNSTSNILIPLDSWTSGLLVYKLPISVDGDDGVGYDDDGDGEVAVMVVLAAVGQQPERRGREKARVGASGVDGRVDRVTRKLFEAHKKTLPEKFSARRHGGTARWQGGRLWGRAAGIHGEGESI
ncbi:hypothetical protein Tco_1176115 [Tanacetum coccineum]